MTGADRRIDRHPNADDRVPVCPECGTGCIVLRTSKRPRWRCEARGCGATFDDPDKRDPAPSSSLGGLSENVKDALRAAGADYPGLAGE